MVSAKIPNVTKYTKKYFTLLLVLPEHLIRKISITRTNFNCQTVRLGKPQGPVGLDMKLSKQNMILSYPLKYDKTCL